MGTHSLGADGARGLDRSDLPGLVAAIVATVVAFDQVDRRAALLVVPYLAWVLFAAYLNAGFWSLN